MFDKIFSGKVDGVKYYEYYPNYSYLNTKYFYEYSDIVNLIKLSLIKNDTSEKWLIFVDKEKDGIQILEQLNDFKDGCAAFISASEIKKNKSAKKCITILLIINDLINAS